MRLRPAGRTVVGVCATTGLTSGALSGHTVRFATFNAALFRMRQGWLLTELSTGTAPHVAAVAETIQRSRPDVLLLNEFEHVPGMAAVDAFRENYLRVAQQGADPIDYPYAFLAPVNSGVPIGFDLDRDGARSVPHDTHGYGYFPGQYGMLVLSRYPVEHSLARTFRTFRWRDMPGALLPSDPDIPGQCWYSADALEVLRLSSRAHWDVPIRIGTSLVHLLAAHPSPPVFDGPEQRNRLRNHDEIRFWADYVTPGAGDYIYDDHGDYGGLPDGEPFVVAGDLNADPVDGFRHHQSISRLLRAPRVRDPRPGSTSGVLAALRQLRGGRTHVGNPFHHTSDFGDEIYGNMRLDYVLASAELPPVRHAVFWPEPGNPLERLNGYSDHHLVWMDIAVPAGRPESAPWERVGTGTFV